LSFLLGSIEFIDKFYIWSAKLIGIMGKLLILIGLFTLIIGLLIEFTAFNLDWFGKIPGDIRIEKPGFSLYIPLVSMLLVSVLFSLILWIVRKINF